MELLKRTCCVSLYAFLSLDVTVRPAISRCLTAFLLFRRFRYDFSWHVVHAAPHRLARATFFHLLFFPFRSSSSFHPGWSASCQFSRGWCVECDTRRSRSVRTWDAKEDARPRGRPSPRIERRKDRNDGRPSPEEKTRLKLRERQREGGNVEEGEWITSWPSIELTVEDAEEGRERR